MEQQTISGYHGKNYNYFHVPKTNQEIYELPPLNEISMLSQSSIRLGYAFAAFNALAAQNAVDLNGSKKGIVNIEPISGV